MTTLNEDNLYLYVDSAILVKITSQGTYTC